MNEKERGQMGDGRTGQVPPATKPAGPDAAPTVQVPPTTKPEVPPTTKPGGSGGGVEEGGQEGGVGQGTVTRGKLDKSTGTTKFVLYVHGIEAGFSDGVYEKDVKLSIIVKNKYTVLDGVIRIKVKLLRPLPEGFEAYGKSYIDGEILADHLMHVDGNRIELSAGQALRAILGKRRP